MSKEMESNEIKSRSWIDWLHDILLREPKDREQLLEMLRDAAERELVSADMLAMIESILQVAEMQVREVIVPKPQMVVVKKEDTLASLLPIVAESEHSRFPVVDEDGEEVIGILLAKDLLKYSMNKPVAKFDVTTIMRPAIFIPQSKRLDVLLREFRNNRNHMAIVIDEYGHLAGLVTIEDVLEQIVGDIEDEYDIDNEDYIKTHQDGTYTVKAHTPIEDFNEFFHADFADEEFDTIGGLVLKNFGHLPKRGEVTTLGDFQFKVLHSDNRRIHLLEVVKNEKAATPEES